jgi:DNA-binding transcriptional regulator YiaG
MVELVKKPDILLPWKQLEGVVTSVSSPMDDIQSISPMTIRALRGGESRAAFAARLGVTANTVYRWELPDDATEARRPRGSALARLLSLGGTSPNVGPESALTDAIATIHRALGTDFVHADEALFRAASANAGSVDARAVLAAGSALTETLLRSNARAAMMLLAPALADVEVGRTSPRAAAWVHAAAAQLHAMSDGRVFDVGRVHAHARRADELAGRDADVARWLGAHATFHAAMQLADDDFVSRALQRFEEIFVDLPLVLALHQSEVRAIALMLAGQPTAAREAFGEVVASARDKGLPVVEARALTLLALRQLDELAPPAGVLELAERAAQLAREARLGPGAHTIFGARARAEALLRLGRTEEIFQTFAELDAEMEAARFPAVAAVPTRVRGLFLTGRHAEIPQIADGLRAATVPSMRGACDAFAAWADAMHSLATDEEGEATIERFRDAERKSTRWNFLQRDVLVFGCTAHILYGSEAEAASAIRRAKRFLDRFPSPWCAAHLRRLEGTMLAARGNTVMGRTLLEAAIATFGLAGDRPDEALSRHTLAAIGCGLGEAGAEARAEETQKMITDLGLVEPIGIRRGVERIRAARSELARARSGATAELAAARLVVPIQRLTVRGMSAEMMLHELALVLEELLGRAPGSIRVEELAEGGRATALVGESADGASFEWAEFGDGAGRRLRVGAAGPLDEGEVSALTILATLVGLALAAAPRPAPSEARGGDGDARAEIGGFVGVSSAARKLRAEVTRLSRTRATVVVVGESGTGKELVARALHEASPRAAGPYVAFNCATVPRDLFEGQLFGYRRGAFTGATTDHLGVLRAAEGGTIFLDEIGELPLDVQPKLLRFLENAEVFPLGEKRPLRVDVRVVAATHRDLAELVRRGAFREDLYYRLAVVTLDVPPLRARREDVAPLARHFLRVLAAPGDPPILSPDAVRRLEAHPWPGNVRELRNVMERTLALAGPDARSFLDAGQLKL